ncbi:hypothetical protein L596_000432 [Steinernema carpocapsae]|uniref:G-protein coupled receptors family 1 profile domain-containing protein n=1 Tax=Steinernema carpocapsae TaxID=34508 RepID=A0A4V6I733_STECR|nr:hypothetical protein L596_000432 [Steinernema carpocapsae]
MSDCLEKVYFGILCIFCGLDSAIVLVVILMVIYRSPPSMRLFSYSILNILGWGMFGNISHSVIVQPRYLTSSYCFEVLGFTSSMPFQVAANFHAATKMSHVHVCIGIYLSFLLRGLQVSTKPVSISNKTVFSVWLVNHGVAQAVSFVMAYIVLPENETTMGTILNSFNMTSDMFSNTVICFSQTSSYTFGAFFVFSCCSLLITAVVVLWTLVRVKRLKAAMTEQSYDTQKRLVINLVIFTGLPVTFIILPSFVTALVNLHSFDDTFLFFLCAVLSVAHDFILSFAMLTIIKPYREAVCDVLSKIYMKTVCKKNGAVGSVVIENK